jgi:hypothetical protein
VPKHEWDVFQDHPTRAVAAALHEPKDLFDQSRAGAFDANVRPDKGQILAWESPHQRVAARQRLEFADIGYQGRVSEIAAKDNLSGRIDLAEQRCFESCSGQPSLKPTDTRE